MATAARTAPASHDVKPSFQITAADGTPLEIQRGEYYFNTKARARRMMLNGLSSYARQVYTCLELATMGFQQELAVRMERGEKRPLRPSDIAQDTELDKENLRLALAELEDAGLAERRSDDDGPLRKGHVHIYCWAFPRPAKRKEDGSARTLQSSLQFPSWFPESWEPLKPLFRRLKLDFNLDESSCAQLLSEGEEIARHYQETEKVVARFLERVSAPKKKRRINKEERTERTLERTDTEGGVTTRHSEPPETAPEPTLPPPPPKHEPLRMPEPLPPLPGKTEPEPETALVPAEDPRREMAWESLRATFEQCGKPISVKHAKACREEFFKHSLEGQLFIAQDATNRKELLWNEPKWTPSPLKYLQSNIWDEEPIKHRTYRAPPKQSEMVQSLNRLMQRSLERERQRNGGS